VTGDLEILRGRLLDFRISRRSAHLEPGSGRQLELVEPEHVGSLGHEGRDHWLLVRRAAQEVVSSLIVVAAIVVAAARDSSPTYLAGSILAGIGFGAAFVGALRALLAKIPAQLIKTAADTSTAAAA
jgi:hypothetical protein